MVVATVATFLMRPIPSFSLDDGADRGACSGARRMPPARAPLSRRWARAPATRDRRRRERRPSSGSREAGLLDRGPLHRSAVIGVEERQPVACAARRRLRRSTDEYLRRRVQDCRCPQTTPPSPATADEGRDRGPARDPGGAGHVLVSPSDRRAPGGEDAPGRSHCAWHALGIALDLGFGTSLVAMGSLEEDRAR
jgi:hypothetical protein